MGIFGFGSSSTPAQPAEDTAANASAEFVSNEEDVYSPSAGAGLDYSDNAYGASNTYDQLPDFLATSSGFDSTRLQPMTVQGGVDFLQVEDQFVGSGGDLGGAALTPSRGWTDDLCYGTGTTYIAGLSLGGAYGLAEGLRKASAPDQPQNMKVRLNTTLNSITRRGPGLGNAVGVIAMMYNGTTALIDHTRGKHDVFSSVAGGAISGAIFKCTAGKF